MQCGYKLHNTNTAYISFIGGSTVVLSLTVPLLKVIELLNEVQ
jgi:hypothetical protein